MVAATGAEPGGLDERQKKIFGVGVRLAFDLSGGGKKNPRRGGKNVLKIGLGKS